MPSSEEVIEEIRESRRRMSRECGHDPARYIQYLKTFNRKYSAQVQKYRRLHPAPPAEIALPK
ncbi:MAG: hypothetical protein ABSE73_12890 [Planctomycetota bacterium]